MTINGQTLRNGAVWDLNGDGRLQILVADESERLHCYQLGTSTYNPLSSVPTLQRTHYRSGHADSFEPNNGEDLDGDGLPDYARHVPSAMTSQGDFYSYLSTEADEDFFVVDTEWSATICLQSPTGLNYNLSVYGTADKLDNATMTPGSDQLPDGLIWTDDSEDTVKCFTAGQVNPPRWAEYKFIIKIWSSGDFSAVWPYWLEIPK